MKSLSGSFRLVFAVASLAVVRPAFSGQVRIDVATVTGDFTPSDVALNVGDHVVWVWTSGVHTLTQGNGCTVDHPIFDTGSASIFAGRYSWKSDRTGTISYFCRPHCTSGETGTLTIQGSGVPVSDFRLTEVRRTVDGSDDFVEIANLGPVSGNLGAYRLNFTPQSNPQLPVADIPVTAGGRVLVHLGHDGENTATDIFLPGITLAAHGAVALVVPNNVQVVPWFGNQVIDYVQWGASNPPDQNMLNSAATAGFWTAGDFLPEIPDGLSIEFCGPTGQYGKSRWKVISTPTPYTTGNCATPAVPATWSRVKTMER